MIITPNVNAVSFVSQSPMPLATLLASYPANSTNLGKYARVTDLYGGADEVMRCTRSGATYYWRPQRSDYAQDQLLTGGAMTLTPLVTPPGLFLTGTLTSNATLTPSSTNAYPGMSFRVTSTGVLGVFGITIAGLLGVSIPLVSGATKVITYSGIGWRSE